MNIAIATGGSLGHVMPAVLLAQYLQDHGHKVVMVGPLQKWIVFIQKYSITIHSIDIAPIRASISSMKQTWQCINHVKNYFTLHDITTVVGFGSYASVPGVLAARMLKARIVLHEQNVVPGRANRFLKRSAHKIAVSFLPTLKYFNDDKAVMTGCPNLFTQPLPRTPDLYQKLSFHEDVPVILVFGGSQGSRDINQLFMNATVKMRTKVQFQVIHVCGSDAVEDVQAYYEQKAIKAQVYSFVRDMSRLYALADIVIARAGALTVTELAHLRKKAVLIPYPHANAHQHHNAAVLQQTGLADIYTGHDANVLGELVVNKLDESLDYEKIGVNVMKLFRKNAHELLAQEVLCDE